MKKPRALAERLLLWLYDSLISLKFAVGVIVSLTIALIIATVMESIYDTPTAQYFVYRSGAFAGVLVALGVNILMVALSRWPWKKSHTPFLLAHLGILTLLTGSWITQRYGLDGTMRVEEGQATPVVELPDLVLFLMEGEKVRSVPIQWVPPMVSFSPIAVEGLPLKVSEFLTHADPEFSFIPTEGSAGTSRVPAVQIRIQGGPMRITQDFWLWQGHAQWSDVQAGPARLQFVKDLSIGTRPAKGPVLRVAWSGAGEAQWEAVSSDGAVKRGRASPAAEGKATDTGWKGGVTITFRKWIPDATVEAKFTPARQQYGNQAPAPAIRLTSSAADESSNSIWLGLGERGTLSIGGREVGIAFMPRRLQLPFALKLDQFQIDRYAGTRDPSSYWSTVSVPGREQIKISMNEPLEHQGVTFYQASYEDAEPRPTVSIFSVNQDPGRRAKYGGSLLIVIGSVLLFSQKLKKTRKGNV